MDNDYYIFIGVVIVTLVVLFLTDSYRDPAPVFAGGVLVATMVYAVYTRKLVNETRATWIETYKTRQASQKPSIIAFPKFIDISNENDGFLRKEQYIYISNIGGVVARNITFEIKDKNMELPEIGMNKIKKGIKYLAPSEEIYDLFNFVGLGSKFDESFNLVICYEYISEEDKLVKTEEVVPIDFYLVSHW